MRQMRQVRQMRHCERFASEAPFKRELSSKERQCTCNISRSPQDAFAVLYMRVCVSTAKASRVTEGPFVSSPLGILCAGINAGVCGLSRPTC